MTSDTVVWTHRYGLERGTPGFDSIGAITFGPDRILFIADNARASILAVDLGDAPAVPASAPLEIEDLDARLAAYLGCSREDVAIRDMAVHQPSREVYLAVMRGSGTAGLPVLMRVEPDGTLAEVPLDDVPFASIPLEDAPAPDDERVEGRVVRGSREGEELELPDGSRLRISRDSLRTVTVTDMSYVDGLLLVAGASNEEFASALRRIPFPFAGNQDTNSLEIFHVSHGRYETASPIRTFVPFGGDSEILASYTCTPVVRFSLEDVRSAAQLRGVTVAELGSRNTPVDMVSYERDGEEYLLVSNTVHPLIKLASRDLSQQSALTEPQEPVGAPRESLPHEGVGYMARYGSDRVLMLQEDAAGGLSLRSYECATL